MSAVETSRPRFLRSPWNSAPLVGAAGVLALVVWRVGRGPFLAGLGSVTARSVAAAAVLGAVATGCCAWRWVLVARGLGVSLPLRVAVTAYYRSQFLNLTLPGGVVGDVHRAASHGREVGDLGGGLRAVAWERTAGQVVQFALTVVVLAVFPSPVRTPMLLAAPVAVGGAGAVLVVVRARSSHVPLRAARVLRAVRADAHRAVLVRGAWPGVVLASSIVVVAHASTFVIAARTAGVDASADRLVPLGILVLLAMALPLSVGGWGVREAVAAPLFAAAGLGADQGVAATTAYAVLVLAASLPGAVVLVASALPPLKRPVVVVSPDGGSRASAETAGAGRV